MIANHILVSFHVAFISSVLAIPDSAATREAVLHFIFLSPETIISAIFTYTVFHSAIAFHELGHFLEAARLRALSDSIQDGVEAQLAVTGSVALALPIAIVYPDSLRARYWNQARRPELLPGCPLQPRRRRRRPARQSQGRTLALPLA